MESELFNLCRPYPIVSLVGLSKSAGKTTTLNALVKAHQQSKTADTKPLALTSVGTGTLQKTRVYSGMYIATAAGVLNDSDFTKKIHRTTNISTPLGEVIIAEALSDGYAALAGPSIGTQLKTLCEYMQKELCAGQVFVDGAGERRTFAVSLGGLILCAGAALSRDIRAVADECEYFCRLMSLPPVSEAGDTVDFHIVQGVLTDESLTELMGDSREKKKPIAVTDASKIFVSPSVMRRLTHNGGQIYVKNAAKLIAITINPKAPGKGYSFDRAEFLAEVKSRVNLPVFCITNY